MDHNNMNLKRKSSYDDHKDDFPTPPWATRALFEYVLPPNTIAHHGVLEPAAGRGHMLKVFMEYGAWADGYDLVDYGAGLRTVDYLATKPRPNEWDFVITNPPYKLAEKFFHKAYAHAEEGVGLLCRTLWAESAGRFDRIFNNRPPTYIGIFASRMPAAKGRLVRDGAMMSHSWFWWDKNDTSGRTQFKWIPPEAQKLLEKEEDYAR